MLAGKCKDTTSLVTPHPTFHKVQLFSGLFSPADLRSTENSEMSGGRRSSLGEPGLGQARPGTQHFSTSLADNL